VSLKLLLTVVPLLGEAISGVKDEKERIGILRKFIDKFTFEKDKSG
jgi:hypothetical protein